MNYQDRLKVLDTQGGLVPLKANPGGLLEPKDVVGRDRLIAKLWDLLKSLSVVLASERRMGKTQLIKKMQAEAPDEVLAIYRDLEGLHTPLEFVNALFTDVEKYLSPRARKAAGLEKLIKSLSGIEIGGIEFITDETGRVFTYDVNTNTNYNADAEARAKRSGMGEIARFLGDELARLASPRDGALRLAG